MDRRRARAPEARCQTRAGSIGLKRARPFVKLEGCRCSAFEALERPAMRPLPATRYQLATWKRARVNIDYRVEYDGRIYSVPNPLVGKSVEIRATTVTIEILHAARRVASHECSYGAKGR